MIIVIYILPLPEHFFQKVKYQRKLVAINGASALIGIARGKIESLSSSIFNNGKIVIPFVNVIDYYKATISS